jgi:hypothetical protein
MITHSSAYGTKHISGGPHNVYFYVGGSAFGGPVKTVLASGNFYTKRQDNGQCYFWSSSGYTTVASC